MSVKIVHSSYMIHLEVEPGGTNVVRLSLGASKCCHELMRCLRKREHTRLTAFETHFKRYSIRVANLDREYTPVIRVFNLE